MAYYRKRRYVKRRSPYRKAYRKRYASKRRSYKPRGSLRSQRGLSRPKRTIRATTSYASTPAGRLKRLAADALDGTEEGVKKARIYAWGSRLIAGGAALGAVIAGVKRKLDHLGDPEPSGRNMWDDGVDFSWDEAQEQLAALNDVYRQPHN